MKTIRTKVYKFSELSKEAQDKALIDHALFVSQYMGEYSVFMKSAKKMDKLQTPWFLPETIFHEQRQELIDEIEINEYDFTKDGKLFHS